MKQRPTPTQKKLALLKRGKFYPLVAYNNKIIDVSTYKLANTFLYSFNPELDALDVQHLRHAKRSEIVQYKLRGG